MKSLILLLALLASPSSAQTARHRKTELITIRIGTVGNQIAFDKPTIHGQVGQKLRLRFVNEAAAGSEILHNLAIIKPGRLEAVVTALQKSGYDVDRMSRDPDVLKVTRALAPTEEDSLDLQLMEPGIYPFLCLMAGHADMLGMKGQLIIDP